MTQSPAEGKLEWDKEYNTYKVFVDKSLKDESASFGVFFGPDHPWNLGCRTANSQDLQSSTCQGIIYALKKLPLDVNVTFYIDQESVLKVLQQLPLPLRVQHKTQKVAYFNHILALTRNRSGTTHFKQIFSHLESDHNTSAEHEDKIQEH